MADDRRGFFLDRDNDGHWYVVDNRQRSRWNAWLSLDGDNPEAWETPIYAVRLPCPPSQIVFPQFGYDGGEDGGPNCFQLSHEAMKDGYEPETKAARKRREIMAEGVKVREEISKWPGWMPRTLGPVPSMPKFPTKENKEENNK